MKFNRVSIVYLIVTLVLLLALSKSSKLGMEDMKTDIENENEKHRHKKKHRVMRYPTDSEVAKIKKTFIEEQGKPAAKTPGKVAAKGNNASCQEGKSNSKYNGKSIGKTTQKQIFITNKFLDFMEDQTIQTYTVMKGHYKSGFMYILEKAPSYKDKLSFTRVYVKISNDKIKFYGTTQEESKFREISLDSITRLGQKFKNTSCFEIIYIKNGEINKLVKHKLLRSEMTVCGINLQGMQEWMNAILLMKPKPVPAPTKSDSDSDSEEEDEDDDEDEDDIIKSIQNVKPAGVFVKKTNGTKVTGKSGKGTNSTKKALNITVKKTVLKKLNVLADFYPINKVLKIQPLVRKIIQKQVEKINAPLFYKMDMVHSKKPVIHYKEQTRTYYIDKKTGKRVANPNTDPDTANNRKLLIEAPKLDINKVTKKEINKRKNLIETNLDTSVTKSSETIQRELKSIHDLMKQSAEKNTIAKRNFVESLNKIKTQKTSIQKQKELLNNVISMRKMAEVSQRSQYRQELLNKRTAALLRRTKEKLKKIKDDELNKIETNFKNELTHEKDKLNSNAVQMLSCIKNEEKNKDASVCYNYDYVGGFKNTKTIKNLCLKFYGEKGAEHCTQKEKFCDMCCAHFIGIKFPEKKINCHKQCTKIINSGAKPTIKEFPPVPDVPNAGCAIIFEEDNFKGNAVQICNKKLTKLDSLWNSSILSVKVGESTNIDLFEKSNFGGKHLSLNSNSANINMKGFDKKFHSLKIEVIPESNCVAIFSKANYQGDTLLKCDHTGDIEAFKNGQATSVKVGKGVNLTAFEKIGAKGKKLVISSNNANINKSGLYNIKYIQTYPMAKLGCTVIFQNPNFQGDSQEICGRVSGNSIGWDSKIGSARVGPSTKLMFYRNDSLRGSGQTISSDVKDFNKVFPNTKILSSRSTAFAAPKTAIIFSKEFYRGKYYIISDDTIENFSSVGWEGKVGSIKLGPSMRLTLYEKNNYKGKSITFSKNSPVIASIFRNIAPQSSKYQIIQIPKAKSGCVILFDEINFEGNNKTFCSGQVSDLSKSGWTFKTLSAKVGNGAVLTLFQNLNNKGRNLKLTRDFKDLRIKRFDTVKSIKVEKPAVPPKRGPISTWRVNEIDSGKGVIPPLQIPKVIVPRAKKVAPKRKIPVRRPANGKKSPSTSSISDWRDNKINNKNGVTSKHSPAHTTSNIPPHSANNNLNKRSRIHTPIRNPSHIIQNTHSNGSVEWRDSKINLQNGATSKKSPTPIRNPSHIIQNTHSNGSVEWRSSKINLQNGATSKTSQSHVAAVNHPRVNNHNISTTTNTNWRNEKINPQTGSATRNRNVRPLTHPAPAPSRNSWRNKKIDCSQKEWRNTHPDCKGHTQTQSTAHTPSSSTQNSWRNSGLRTTARSTTSTYVRSPTVNQNNQNSWRNTAVGSTSSNNSYRPPVRRSVYRPRVRRSVYRPPVRRPVYRPPPVSRPVYRPPPTRHGLRQGCVRMYEDVNYRGRSYTLCGNHNNFVRIGWNDKASSLLVGPRTGAYFYQHTYYRGRAVRFTADHPNFTWIRFNDDASSAKVFTW